MKSIQYSESDELRILAEKLRARYINLIGYINLDSIFFAFKSGDVKENFRYECLGVQSDWVAASNKAINNTKLYCIAMSFDFYQRSLGSLIEWIMIECLYSCHPNMNGKMRAKDIHEFSRILLTLEDLNISHEWRENTHLPELLGDETVVFALGDPEEE